MTTVTLLNASYEPLGTVTFQHAVRMLFREVATVEEAHDDRMIGPHPWPRVNPTLGVWCRMCWHRHAGRVHLR